MKFKDVILNESIQSEILKVLGRSDKKVEKEWKERQDAANKNKKTPRGITWSTQIDWGGFSKHISYAKVADTDETINLTSTDIGVKFNYNGKEIYKNKKDVMNIKMMLEPYLKSMRTPTGKKYWKF